MTITKLVLPFSLILGILISCSSAPVKGTRLKGLLNTGKEDTLIVYGADALFSRVDSIILHEGEIDAVLETDTMALCWIQSQDGQRYPLFLDRNATLKISGDSIAEGHLEVYGTQENDTLTAFLLRNRENLGDLEFMQKAAEEFIQDHSASAVSVYLLERYFLSQRITDIERIAGMVKSLGLELQDWSFINSFSEYYNDLKGMNLGKDLPFFRGIDPKGEAITRTNTFRSKYLVVYFWASYSPASRALKDTYRALIKSQEKAGDVAVLGMSLDSDKESWKKAIEEDSITWKQVIFNGSWNSEAIQKFGIRDLPREILVSPTGEMLAFDLMDQTALSEAIQKERDKKEEQKKKASSRLR